MIVAEPCFQEELETKPETKLFLVEYVDGSYNKNALVHAKSKEQAIQFADGMFDIITFRKYFKCRVITNDYKLVMMDGKIKC
jgi:hypothetical protein